MPAVLMNVSISLGSSGQTENQKRSIVSTSPGSKVSIEATNMTGVVSIGGDTFVLTAPGVVSATCGTEAETLKFAGMKEIKLTAGSAEVVAISDNGANTWTAGLGALTVTGGSGRNTYIYHAGDARLTITDFAAIKGDVLMIDKALKGSIQQAPDGRGGILLTFGTGGGIDVYGGAAFPPSSIHWV